MRDYDAAPVTLGQAEGGKAGEDVGGDALLPGLRDHVAPGEGRVEPGLDGVEEEVAVPPLLIDDPKQRFDDEALRGHFEMPTVAEAPVPVSVADREE